MHRSSFVTFSLGWVLHGLIKATIAMPGEKAPIMVYAAALLLFELGDLNVVNAAALQESRLRILLEFLFIASLVAVEGFAL